MTKEVSKLLSYWLRHDPEAGGLMVDGSGWVEINAVRISLAREGVSPSLLDRTIAESDKQRFEVSADGSRVRARQGHSIAVDLDWPIATPPEHLYHGTVDRFLEAILREGLKPMGRHHVHLSQDPETATRVGARRGHAVILRIAAGEMEKEGSVFRLSSNGVWLTQGVAPKFIQPT